MMIALHTLMLFINLSFNSAFDFVVLIFFNYLTDIIEVVILINIHC